MLEAKEVRKTYQTGGSALEVLRGVSLRIEPGAFISIMGPSGAGKSTLLHLLAGLDRPTSGEVSWQGKSLAGMGDTELARFRNEAIGVVFQFYHLLPELNALENVMLPRLVRGERGGSSLRDQAAGCLEQVGLAGRLTHKPNALSGGELQRAVEGAALARPVDHVV
jgi:predicted ABC-type transport system involved in lysophospholipase L1 biosynthesis ATPase subunit